MLEFFHFLNDLHFQGVFLELHTCCINWGQGFHFKGTIKVMRIRFVVDSLNFIF